FRISMVIFRNLDHRNYYSLDFHGWIHGIAPWELSFLAFPWLIARIQAMGISRIGFSMVDGGTLRH
ncbi:MAG: hypothetical protein IJU49_04285, partial [Lachnospiraceae bacterium]|nr:hypothetical protein [Lachnospiraceae bacterium]